MIRQARDEDVLAVLQLVEELEEMTFDKQIFIDRWKKHQESEWYQCIVYDDGKVKGYLSYMYKEPLHHIGTTCEILDFCVGKNYRNAHIGSKLLSYVENECKIKHIEEIELSSNIKRKDAHRFYQSHGYVLDHYNLRKRLL